jgi:hypothetical protein
MPPGITNNFNGLDLIEIIRAETWLYTATSGGYKQPLNQKQQGSGLTHCGSDQDPAKSGTDDGRKQAAIAAGQARRVPHGKFQGRVKWKYK